MQYRNDRRGEPVSVLGFGCMRFPRKGSAIDREEAEREILEAVNQGVNYFDTAYIYPGSEACLGEILEKNGIRDRVRIADKLPGYLIQRAGRIQALFDEQLARLRTDHIDYYLIHMLTDVSSWEKLRDMGIQDWIREQKSRGTIRQIGFSYHGDSAMFQKVLDAYDWDFCQIQYNYMDEHTQAGRTGLQAAAGRGIPVIIMEPLRGGTLVNLLPDEAVRMIREAPGVESPAQLAFSWLWDQKEVTCVLSGMNSLDMVQENCRWADAAVPGYMTEETRALTGRVRDVLRSRILVGCTGCRYCMPCPHGVDIPGTLHCYNLTATERPSSARHEFMQTIALREQPATPDQCIGCHACEKKCPQHLPIVESLEKARRALMPPHYRLAMRVARGWLYYRRKRKATV